MRITFLGAAREVTGSSYLLEVNNKRILVDCGLFQGGKFAEHKNFEPFHFKPNEIDAVFVSHAHLDHAGRLPKLVKEGYRGPIYMTLATRELLEVMLEDSVRLMRKEARRGFHRPLYGPNECKDMFKLAVAKKYREQMRVNNVCDVIFHDAGHILGSAFIEITYDGRGVVFSGDLGNAPSPLIKWPARMPSADSLILESTYGARVHESFAERKFKLRRAVMKTVNNKGVLLIPTFALERTQELLYELNYLHQENLIPEIPVFIDSPLAIRATKIFKKYPDLYNEEVSRMLQVDPDVFSFPGLVTTHKYAQSQKIISVPPPKIIIAGSGMMNGGRIVEHAKNYLEDARNMLLIVGFQAKGSLGRRLFDGDKSVRIEGRLINVRAQIEAIGAYSAHADQPSLLYWIGGAVKKPKKIFLTHGEEEQALALAKEIEHIYRIKPVLPLADQQFML